MTLMKITSKTEQKNFLELSLSFTVVFDSNKVTENYTWDKCATKVGRKVKGRHLKTRNTSTNWWRGGRGGEGGGGNALERKLKRKEKMKRNCRGRVGNGEEKNRERVEIKMIGDRKRERE